MIEKITPYDEDDVLYRTYYAGIAEDPKVWHLGAGHGFSKRVADCRLSRDGQRLYALCTNGSFATIDAESGEFIAHSFVGEVDKDASFALSEELGIAAAGNESGEVVVLSCDDLSVLNSIPAHEGPVTCARFDERNELLFTGSRDSKIKIWKLEGSDVQLMRSVPAKGELRIFEPLKREELLIGQNNHDFARIWDVHTGRWQFKFK